MANFRQVVNQIASRALVTHGQAAIRAAHGKGATRWVADMAGVSPRTARRWMSANPPASRIVALLALLSPTDLAAQQIRGASAIDVGAVAVSYDDTDEGSRSIGHLDVDEAMARELDAAAEALENGDLLSAEDAFSNAVMMGYADGLQDTLTVADYADGVHLR